MPLPPTSGQRAPPDEALDIANGRPARYQPNPSMWDLLHAAIGLPVGPNGAESRSICDARSVSRRRRCTWFASHDAAPIRCFVPTPGTSQNIRAVARRHPVLGGRRGNDSDGQIGIPLVHPEPLPRAHAERRLWTTAPRGHCAGIERKARGRDALRFELGFGLRDDPALVVSVPSNRCQLVSNITAIGSPPRTGGLVSSTPTSISPARSRRVGKADTANGSKMPACLMNENVLAITSSKPAAHG